MTVRNLQAVGDEAGVLQPPALALRFRSPLTVTPVPEETSPGMVGNGQSVRGYTEIGVDPSASVSSYIQPTGSGGSSGLSVGRFDITALNPYAPIPGTLVVGNDDGSDYSFQIDNGSSLITSNMDLTVNGRTTVTGPIAANGGISVTGSLTVGGSSVVTVARTISTTAPLSGGGALSSNLTLAISAASGSAAGSMSASDYSKLAGYPSSPSGLTIAESQVTNLVTDLAGKVPTTRTVTGTSGQVLVNGGTSAVALSNDLTLALPSAVAITTSLTVNGKGIVGPNARSVTHSDSPVTAADGDVITMDATAGTISVTVPVTAGARVKLKRKITDTSANAITVSPASGTVEGGATLTFPTVAGSALEINGDGTNAGLW